eukprot:428071_1
MSSMKRIKNVDAHSKYCVFGYIREMELNLKLPTIPLLISYICVSYFYEPEYFSKARPDCFKISENKLTITNIKTTNDNTHTVYCHKWTNSMSNSIVKWTFVINGKKQDTDSDGIFFGFVTQENKGSILCDFSSNRELPNYAIGHNGTKFFGSAICNTEASYGFDEKDEIEYTLNLKNASISSNINNANDLILFNNIERSGDINYKMVVQMPAKGDSVTLKKFYIAYS